MTVFQKSCWHVPFNWSEMTAELLHFPNNRIRVVLIGKRVNRGAGFGLEIPVDYNFYGDSRITTWLKKGLEK